MGDVGEYFNRSEFACKCGCGKDDISLELVGLLDALRVSYGPIVILSGFRCKKHNDDSGGVDGSAHMYGLAVDIKCKDSASRFKLLRSILNLGVSRIGIAKTFIHIDIDEQKPSRVTWLY